MATTWLVRFRDVERNFASRRAAVAWLRRRTHDERPFLALQRRGRGTYRYFGPGEDQWVLVADLDRLRFPGLRWYRPRGRRRRTKGELV